MKQLLASLQKIGGALMLPIAVLPIAGLLLRLGQPDLLNFPSMAAAGGAIFDNLGILFAIGVAVGLARENHGAAGLASVVGYLVTTKGAEVLINVPPGAIADLTGQAHDLAVAAYKAHELAKLSVPAGIISGLTAGALYNRFSNINLPSYLDLLRWPPLRAYCERVSRDWFSPGCSVWSGSTSRTGWTRSAARCSMQAPSGCSLTAC